MAKIRLTENLRSSLRDMAAASLSCPAEQKEYVAAYERMAATVTGIVEKRFPPADMALLQKYEVAKRDGCIRLQLVAGGIVQFVYEAKPGESEPGNYGDDTLGPLRPAGQYCTGYVYLTSDAQTKLFEAFTAKRDAFKNALSQKKADYRALITASQTLEEVEAIWPAASALRAKIVQNLPATLTNDIVERIKADVALQSKRKRAA